MPDCYLAVWRLRVLFAISATFPWYDGGDDGGCGGEEITGDAKMAQMWCVRGLLYGIRIPG
jgi:hypothetical protein